MHGLRTQFSDYVFNGSALGLREKLVHEIPSAYAAHGNEHEGKDLPQGGRSHKQEYLGDRIVRNPVHSRRETITRASEVEGVNLGIDCPGDRAKGD